MQVLIQYFLCLVISAQADGFRRAGFALNRGENTGLVLTPSQIEQFKADPTMTIEVGQEVDENGQPIGENSLRRLFNGENSLDATVLDLSAAPKELAPFIAAMHQLQCKSPLNKKPIVDALEVDLALDSENPETLTKVKPTGEQRDLSWQWYQDNVISHIPGS